MVPLELLADPKNRDLLDQLQAQQSEPDAPALDVVNRDLRKGGASPELAAVLVGQLELRAAAQNKFGTLAKTMIFTRAGLEQASRLPVARLHAERYRQAGKAHVADLGCGIGADSLGFALSGAATFSVDLDASAYFCARTNLSPFATAEVARADLTDYAETDLRRRGVDSIFLDPARRSPTGRQFDPHRWAPPWGTILKMTQWGLPVGVKVAPGIKYSHLPPDHHAQWVSADGNLVEASLWSPQLAPEGAGRSAALLFAPDPDETNPTVCVLTDPKIQQADEPVRPAPNGGLGEYIFEANPAVIRAGLLGRLAELTGTHLIDENIAYLTGPNPVDSPFLTSYRTLANVALRTKTIKQALRSLDGGWVEVKKRGANVDPAALQKELQTSGSRPLVVFATRIQGKHRAIIATRNSNQLGDSREP